MKVYINDKIVTIFKGATVSDAVLTYSKHSYKLLQGGYLSIFDRFGNLTEPDGSVVEGQHFQLKVTGKKQINI